MPITLLLLDHDALSQVQVACKGMAVLLPVPMRTSEFCRASPSSQENRDCKRSLLVAEGECLWDTPGIAPWSACLSSPGVDDPHQHGRGVALADFNRDGKVDIVYGNWNGPHRLYLQMSAHGKVRFRVRTARCCMAAWQTIRDRNLLCASMGLSRAGGGVPRKATCRVKDTSLSQVQAFGEQWLQRKRSLQGIPQEPCQRNSLFGNYCSLGLPGHPTSSC